MDGVFTFLVVNSKMLLSIDPNTVGPVTKSVQLLSQIIICIVGVGGIVAFFFKGRFKTLKAIKTMVNTVNAFMEKILPDLLQGFEKKQFVPSGTLADWAKTVSAKKYSTESPKRLNKEGERILKESGIKQIIDEHLESFIEELEKKNLESPLDLESQSFDTLKKREKDKITIPVRYYLYEHAAENIDTIFFIGSIYLRDKYIKKHPEMIFLNDQTGSVKNNTKAKNM